MAKHMIYPHPNPDGTDADRRVEIHWQRHPTGDVRVGTSVFGGVGDRTHDYTDDGAEVWPGQFVELDRSQINHLIRQLRAARDQAYGRDE